MKAISLRSRVIVPGAVCFAAMFAGMEAAASVRPPLPGQVDAPPTWLYYLILVALVVATVALSIMPSKRGHQD